MTWYDGGDEPATELPTGRRARRDRSAGARPGAWPGVRWRLGPRAVAGALIALALVGGAVALRSAAASPSGPPVDLPEPRAGASITSGAEDGSAAREGTAATTPSLDPSAPGVAPEPDGVVVHVVGQVGAPGVVTLPVGSRVADAVAAAGGALPGADLSALNLAAVLTDGAQVRVPAPGEPVTSPSTVGGAVSTTGGDAAAGAASGVAPVDLNAATATELDTLPGIGPVLAERIVGWRTEHGRFAAVDDLQQVSGIGPAVMDRLRDLVRV